ncbi:hypothetical protein [Citricoccus sp. NR2]|uniref:hypothetical protein n=1 Tax=Citricoccus sp. NR2 TaxID=3004095 RepID=UPI0022DDF74D|nr:hypothetical protein [Citricoccus sp. NR2]WBL18489.1 hypothetical protein O1A05_12075 [Citricoccus sp. NR2]
MSDWHSFFALWPVRTSTGWVWLHWVDRRAVDVEWADYYGDGTTLTTRHYEHRRKR